MNEEFKAYQLRHSNDNQDKGIHSPIINQSKISKSKENKI